MTPDTTVTNAGCEIPANRRSGGTAYDDTTLTLQRTVTLARSIHDDTVDERPVDTCMTAMLELELEYLDAAIRDLDPGRSGPGALAIVRECRPDAADFFKALARRAESYGYTLLVDSSIRDGDNSDCYHLLKGGELCVINADFKEVAAWLADRAEAEAEVDGAAGESESDDAENAPPERQLHATAEHVDEPRVVLDVARVALDSEKAETTSETEAFDPISSLQNPLKAFLSATKPLDGCRLCDDEAFHRGGHLVAIMAAQLRDQDDDPKLPLTIGDCAAVLAFLIGSQGVAPGLVQLAGGNTDEQIEKYGGAPSFGLHLILRHLSEQLRQSAGGAAA